MKLLRERSVGQSLENQRCKLVVYHLSSVFTNRFWREFINYTVFFLRNERTFPFLRKKIYLALVGGKNFFPQKLF